MLRKKGSMGTDEILIIILVILVVGSVAAFIFRANITSYFKLLPSFSSGDNSIDANQNLNQDTSIVPDEEVEAGCTIIGKIDITDGKYYLYLGDDKTDLYLKEIKDGAGIKVEKSWDIVSWGIDPTVGTIVVSLGKKPAITFDTSSSEYKDYLLESGFSLSELEGAYYLENYGNSLCRKPMV